MVVGVCDGLWVRLNHKIRIEGKTSFYGNNDMQASKVVVFHYLMNNVVVWKVVWFDENFAWIELKEARVINGKELVGSILVIGKRQSRK